jgi:hypothetical protein
MGGILMLIAAFEGAGEGFRAGVCASSDAAPRARLSIAKLNNLMFLL